ncbi:MAG TPA: WGxxGxxG family protein [Gemmatimonadaceae bacterium]|nr:WGxxGxxG family protein [Gemmatimonadaceae bacterium]
MTSNKARVSIRAAAIAATILCSPIAMHAQTADSTRTYATTTTDNNDRHFDWGWLGLLGLLGLIPRKRKDTVVETRTTGTTGTGAGGRY